MKIEPKLAFYIEEYNKSGEDMKEATRRMDGWRKYAKNECGVDIANDRSVN